MSSASSSRSASPERAPLISDKVQLLAAELGVDLATVPPTDVCGRRVITVHDVRKAAPAATPQQQKKKAKQVVDDWVTHHSGDVRTKPTKRKRQQAQDEAPGDPLLLDGNTVQVQWPIDDQHTNQLQATVKWLKKRANCGKERVYKLTFDDGDTRMTGMLNKVAFRVESSEYEPGHQWTEREETALKARCTASIKEDLQSIACSLGRSYEAVVDQQVKLMGAEEPTLLLEPSDATLKDLEQQLEGHDPLNLVGCVLEVRALALRACHMWCWQMERRLGGARECATVIKYKDGVYRLVFASGDRKKLKPAQLLQRKHKLLEAPEGKPPQAVVPTDSAVELSNATLSGLEQLEAQEVDDGYDPLILVGCVLEVPAWPCSVHDNSLVVVAGREARGWEHV